MAVGARISPQSTWERDRKNKGATGGGGDRALDNIYGINKEKLEGNDAIRRSCKTDEGTDEGTNGGTGGGIAECCNLPGASLVLCGIGLAAGRPGWHTVA